MWKLAKEPEIVKLSKSLAKEFVDMMACPGDRGFKPGLMEVIDYAVKTGQFRSATWAIGILNGVKYRGNGKHTSRYFYDMTDPLPDARITVETYNCDTLKDLTDLYRTFDNIKTGKSANDVYQSCAASCSDICDIHRGMLTTCASGIAFAYWEDRSQSHTAEEKGMLLVENSKFVAWFNTNFAGNVKWMLRQSTCAAAYLTWKRSPAAADDFWKQVFTGSQPNPNSPSRFLQRYLMTTVLRRAYGKEKTKKDESVRGMFCKSLLAWNAWRSGRETIESLRFMPGNPTPDVK